MSSGSAAASAWIAAFAAPTRIGIGAMCVPRNGTARARSLRVLKDHVDYAGSSIAAFAAPTRMGLGVMRVPRHVDCKDAVPPTA